MTRTDLSGKRFIGLLRCSSAAQIDTSIDDQRRLLDAFAREHGMVFVDHVALEGVSGSVPGNRSDIQLLIDRKDRQDDFDVLLVQDTSRFTRAGTQHAHRLESDLNAAGIEVVYAAGAIPSGAVGDLVKSVYAFADQHHAQSISFNSTRGSMSSILDGRSPYCRRPPYAIDRLYVAPDGTPLHIIRNLPNRYQLKLHPETREVIGKFEPNARRGVPNHYIKQKQERVVLVPGDERCVETLRRVFRLRFIDNWGAFRIAQALNCDGVPSPEGKLWNTTTVNVLLDNPIYLGRGIANRFTSAIYHMRAEDRPREADVDKQELYRRKRPARRTRPGSDWHYQEHPQLAELLDPEVREIAAAWQQNRLDAKSIGHVPKPNRDRHRTSPYFLKDILRSRQGDYPMSGVLSGSTGARKRYYRVARAYRCPNGDKVLRAMIPAEPLEQMALELVRRTLVSLTDLRERIEKQVRATLQSRTDIRARRDELVAERDAIRSKLELVIDTFDPAMKELTERKLAELRGRLRIVESQLVECAEPDAGDEADVAAIVDDTVAAVERLAETIAEAPPATLNRLLKILVSRLVVDLETRDVELEIALPTTLDARELTMCLVEGSACKPCNETHPPARLSLAEFRLCWDSSHQVFSTHPCRRRPRAA